MKKLALSLVGAGSVAVMAFVATPERVETVSAADHIDSPSVRMASNAAADLTDVYAWTWNDGAGPALAMILNVSPDSAPTDAFAQNLHYAFHLGRGGSETEFICQFESDDNSQIRCWVGSAAENTVIAGDPSSAGSPLVADGIRIFAGRRKDPFTFNAAGFSKTAAFVNANADSLVEVGGSPGCYDLSGANPAPVPDLDVGSLAEALRVCLRTQCQNDIGAVGQAAAQDAFATHDVLSLVVSIPLTAIAGSGDNVTVYASTHSR